MAHQYKVLSVDDAEINRAFLSDVLSEEYDILEASNGLEATVQLTRYHYFRGDVPGIYRPRL